MKMEERGENWRKLWVAGRKGKEK
uniref:Uncharacterized protein n=1 Tax=Rhizophora mucronata TaxID=61149 RepID=A0A2P2PTC1_RHIMU